MKSSLLGIALNMCPIALKLIIIALIPFELGLRYFSLKRWNPWWAHGPTTSSAILSILFTSTSSYDRMRVHGLLSPLTALKLSTKGENKDWCSALYNLKASKQNDPRMIQESQESLQTNVVQVSRLNQRSTRVRVGVKNIWPWWYHILQYQYWYPLIIHINSIVKFSYNHLYTLDNS